MNIIYINLPPQTKLSRNFYLNYAIKIHAFILPEFSLPSSNRHYSLAVFQGFVLRIKTNVHGFFNKAGFDAEVQQCMRNDGGPNAVSPQYYKAERKPKYSGPKHAPRTPETMR